MASNIQTVSAIQADASRQQTQLADQHASITILMDMLEQEFVTKKDFASQDRRISSELASLENRVSARISQSTLDRQHRESSPGGGSATPSSPHLSYTASPLPDRSLDEEQVKAIAAEVCADQLRVERLRLESAPPVVAHDEQREQLLSARVASIETKQHKLKDRLKEQARSITDATAASQNGSDVATAIAEFTPLLSAVEVRCVEVERRLGEVERRPAGPVEGEQAGLSEQLVARLQAIEQRQEQAEQQQAEHNLQLVAKQALFEQSLSAVQTQAEQVVHAVQAAMAENLTEAMARVKEEQVAGEAKLEERLLRLVEVNIEDKLTNLRLAGSATDKEHAAKLVAMHTLHKLLNRPDAVSVFSRFDTDNSGEPPSDFAMRLPGCTA